MYKYKEIISLFNFKTKKRSSFLFIFCEEDQSNPILRDPYYSKMSRDKINLNSVERCLLAVFTISSKGSKYFQYNIVKWIIYSFVVFPIYDIIMLLCLKVWLLDVSEEGNCTLSLKENAVFFIDNHASFCLCDTGKGTYFY